jgi:hypothetical protein
MALKGGAPDRDLDERTLEELALQASLNAAHQCPFVFEDYWRSRRPPAAVKELFWCSIDLEKFYPTLNVATIRQNIVKQLPLQWQPEAARLLDSMFRFEVERGLDDPDMLAKVGLGRKRSLFTGIPTGLYVAGFLANAGLLSVDEEVSRRLHDRPVAHFRFVDDHIALAYSMGDLTAWVEEYRGLLRAFDTGARINRDKIEPKELGRLIFKPRAKRTEKALRAAQDRCSLDPQFPSPLMTKTLALVSAIARTDFNLLDPSELAALTDQLEHLALVDIPEEEIPAKTRLSFAATRLTRLVESRLATSTPPAELRMRQERFQRELPLGESEGPRPRRIDQDVAQPISREVERVFQLFRKVLRERFDSVRLWSRAFQMCRSTGVDGLPDLAADINHV